MLVLTYVYRIRPTAAQHVQLSNILANQRYLYNAALEERIAAWKRGLAITMNDQTKSADRDSRLRSRLRRRSLQFIKVDFEAAR